MSLVVQTGDGDAAHTHAHTLPTAHMQLSGPEATALIGSEAVLKTGWLYKRGGRTKVWKRRWFVLRKDRLAYYKDETEYETRRVVPIDEISGITCQTGLKGKRSTISFYIRDKQAHLQVESLEAADDWTNNLKMAIKLDDVQHSMPSSAIDIRTGRSGKSAHGGSSQTLGSMQLPVSRSIHFSDDDLSAALMSDDEITSPLSQASTFHEESDRVTRPQTANDDPLQMDKVIIEGYLRRHIPKSLRGSVKVWAVLRAYGLYLYPDDKEYRPVKVISFTEMVDASDLPDSDEISGSQQSKKKVKYRFQVITKDKALRFSVENEKVLDEWLGALKSRLEMKEMQEKD